MTRVLKYNLQRPCGPVRPPSLRCVTAYAIDQDACEQLQCESIPKPVLCSKPYKPVRGIGCCGSDRFTSWILSVEDLRPFPFQTECSDANGTYLLSEIDPTKLFYGSLMADPTKRTWAYAYIGDENGRVPELYPYSPHDDDYDAYAPTPWIWILQCLGPYFNQNDINDPRNGDQGFYLELWMLQYADGAGPYTGYAANFFGAGSGQKCTALPISGVGRQTAYHCGNPVTVTLTPVD